MTRKEVIRSPQLRSAISVAVAGNSDPLFSLLARLSGLPGPSPNWAVAEAVGRELSVSGGAASATIARLCSPTRPFASSLECAFYPICGAMALAFRHLEGDGAALDAMRELADDTRLPVRTGVVRALVHIGRARADDLVDGLSAWMGETLSAAVALEAVASRAVLDNLRRAEPLVMRLDEAFSLVENAGRADQRTQGWRLLCKVVSEVPAAAMDRFAGPVVAWLERRAATSIPELRLGIEHVLVLAQGHGHSDRDLAAISASLSESAKPRRDPRTYVGPTRRRGANRRGG